MGRLFAGAIHCFCCFLFIRCICKLYFCVKNIIPGLAFFEARCSYGSSARLLLTPNCDLMFAAPFGKAYGHQLTINAENMRELQPGTLCWKERNQY